VAALKKRVLLGMSGGVDSTAAAIVLKDAGYEVLGVYMKMHDDEEFHRTNFEKASRVAESLGIEILFHDISDRFTSEVYDYFVDEYIDGRTPNPCIVCNRKIKFGEMVDFADTLGIEMVATGHYARSEDGRIRVAADREKDQSYFLAMLKREVLPRLLFPVGDMKKEEVRALTKNIELFRDIAEQKESQEICFVEDSYIDVLSRHMEVDREGEVVDRDGNVIGIHRGYMHYTVGKRRGFTVRGAHDPHYVLSLDADTNRIVVGKRDELAVDRIELEGVNLLGEFGGGRCGVKARYRMPAVEARVEIDGDRAAITLEEPVYGVARGQYGVFYDGDTLLGGGVIV